MDLLYENVETEVMAYLSKLIERAIEPYNLEIEGSYKLSALKSKLEGSLKKLLSKINGCDARTHKKNLCSECAQNMCSHMNEEIFELFRNHSNGSFFLIDFMAFSFEISEFLEKTLKIYIERRKLILL